jgi:hypothetical protein
MDNWQSSIGNRKSSIGRRRKDCEGDRMNDTAQSPDGSMAQSPDLSRVLHGRGAIKAKTLKGLHAEWRKLSAGLAGLEGLTEREFRLFWTNSKLGTTHGRSVNSWNELSERQARFILRQMCEATGDGPAYRARLIITAAAMLWQTSTETELTARLWQRYAVKASTDLTPEQAHAVIEELIERAARRDVAMAGDDVSDLNIVQRKIEELRKRLKGKLKN